MIFFQQIRIGMKINLISIQKKIKLWKEAFLDTCGKRVSKEKIIYGEGSGYD